MFGNVYYNIGINTFFAILIVYCLIWFILNKKNDRIMISSFIIVIYIVLINLSFNWYEYLADYYIWSFYISNITFKNAIYFIPIIVTIIITEIISYFNYRNNKKNIINNEENDTKITNNKLIDDKKINSKKNIMNIYLIINVLAVIIIIIQTILIGIFTWWENGGRKKYVYKMSNIYETIGDYESEIKLLKDNKDRVYTRAISDNLYNVVLRQLYEKQEYEKCIELNTLLKENLNDEEYNYRDTYYGCHKYTYESFKKLYNDAKNNNDVEQMKSLKNRMLKITNEDSWEEHFDMKFDDFSYDDEELIYEEETNSNNYYVDEYYSNSVITNLSKQINISKTIYEYTDENIDEMDTICFGNDNENNLLEWIVLEKDDEKALLYSKYVLCNAYYDDYNEYNNKISWEKSDIRWYLNNVFFNNYFDQAEKNAIIETKNETTNNPRFDTDNGKTTFDKFFILSSNECNKYFCDNKYIFDDKKTEIKKLTSYISNKYNIYQPYNVTNFEKYEDWSKDNIRFWLRDLGETKWTACFVDKNGFINTRGEYVEAKYGIRPAVWVKLK